MLSDNFWYANNVLHLKLHAFYLCGVSVVYVCQQYNYFLGRVARKTMLWFLNDDDNRIENDKSRGKKTREKRYSWSLSTAQRAATGGKGALPPPPLMNYCP